jgi:hypothetical protein
VKKIFIQSLQANLIDLSTLIDEIEFHDIIVAVKALQETWKIPHVHQLIIIGFPPLLYTGRQGAGEVGFYINTDINFF